MWRVAFVSALFLAGIFGSYEWALWQGASVAVKKAVRRRFPPGIKA